MKTCLGALIVLVGLLCGCGTTPTEVREAPPVTAAPPPVTPVPSPTPGGCTIHKLCDGLNS